MYLRKNGGYVGCRGGGDTHAVAPTSVPDLSAVLISVSTYFRIGYGSGAADKNEYLAGMSIGYTCVQSTSTSSPPPREDT